MQPGGDPLVLCFVDFLSPAHAATAMDALQGELIHSCKELLDLSSFSLCKLLAIACFMQYLVLGVAVIKETLDILEKLLDFDISFRLVTGYTTIINEEIMSMKILTIWLNAF